MRKTLVSEFPRALLSLAVMRKRALESRLNLERNVSLTPHAQSSNTVRYQDTSRTTWKKKLIKLHIFIEIASYVLSIRVDQRDLSQMV